MIQVVQELDPPLAAELRAFLAAAPAGSGVCPEHDLRWLEVLREGLRHQPVVLIARSGGAADAPIVGYLPLCLVASRLFGRFLVSLPYLNRAGIVAADPDTDAALVDEAVRQAEARNVQYLEMRHHDRVLDHPSLPTRREEKVRMVLELPADPDGLWNLIGSKVRNLIRKGDKSDLTIRWGGTDLLNDFYDVFAINMRDLGTPVFPKRLFGSILRYFEQEAELAVVSCGQTPAAGALLVHDAGGGERPASTQVPSASCLRQFNATNANMWMYHHLLLRSIARGSREFDFGRSSEDSGTYRFKKQWGATPRPTVWQYHVRRGDISAMRPDSPKNRRRIETWQKLPVWLTRLVGPAIVRGIP